ncbi:hypothetical protein ACFSYH_08240 [Populibacterium corticicola]|uniref:Ribbon-helix-helix protein, CopG family n=1 Tax=Populibacterium corticicola TaxID=1812826 RepID=A0ABW5XFA8_9MICO
MAVVNIRVEDHVRDLLKRKADDEGVTLSEYVREVLVAAIIPVGTAATTEHGDEQAPETMTLFKRHDGGNSHIPTLAWYSRLLAEYRRIMDARERGHTRESYLLSAAELRQVKDARTHPSTRRNMGTAARIGDRSPTLAAVPSEVESGEITPDTL